MNKRGQMSIFSVIMVMFMAIIVGVVLFQVVAQEVGRSTSTETLLFDDTLDVIANDTSQYITNWRALNDVTVYNETGHEIIPAGHYTIVNNVVRNGALTVNFTPYALNYENTTNAWRMNATGQPTTYIADSGSRAVAGLIVIFFALAIAVVALEPTLRSGFMDAWGG